MVSKFSSGPTIPGSRVLWSPFLKKKKKKLFIFGCARSSLLHMTFSSCSEQGPLFIAILSWGTQASHWGGFFCCRAQVLGPQASVVAPHGLSCCYKWTSVAPQHIKSSWIRDRTCVPCIGRQTLSTETPGKFGSMTFWFLRWLLNCWIVNDIALRPTDWNDFGGESYCHMISSNLSFNR